MASDFAKIIIGIIISIIALIIVYLRYSICMNELGLSFWSCLFLLGD